MDQKPNKATLNQQLTYNSQPAADAPTAMNVDYQQNWVPYFPTPVYYVYQPVEQNPACGQQHSMQPSTSQPVSAANNYFICNECRGIKDDNSSSTSSTPRPRTSTWETSSSTSTENYRSESKEEAEIVRESPESPEPASQPRAQEQTKANMGIVNLNELIVFLDNWMARLKPNQDGDLLVGA